jgi:hypothetical protein
MEDLWTGGQVVADLQHFDDEQDPDPDLIKPGSVSAFE